MAWDIKQLQIDLANDRDALETRIDALSTTHDALLKEHDDLAKEVKNYPLVQRLVFGVTTMIVCAVIVAGLSLLVPKLQAPTALSAATAAAR